MRVLFVLGLAACSGHDGIDPILTPVDTGDTTPTDTVPVTGTSDERVDAIVALDGVAADGASVFTTQCNGCHGADGAGSLSGPALTDRLLTMTEDDVVSTVLRGIGNMDSYAALANQDIADVAAYALETFGPGTM